MPTRPRPCGPRHTLGPVLVQDALRTDRTYMSSLTRSMSLVLDEFYNTLRVRTCAAVRYTCLI